MKYRYAVKIAIFDFMSHYDLSAIRSQLSDSSRKLADLTASMVFEKPSLLKLFIKLSWSDEEPWSQRASRIVAICCCTFPELILPYTTQIIKRLSAQKSEGSRRNFLKIFTEADVMLKSREKSILLNSCFDFLNGDYSIAVKVYSMDILFKMSQELPDIRKELYAVIMDQMEDGSVGFRSHALKILKKLENPSNSRKLKTFEDH